jgi:hypothetical protein
MRPTAAEVTRASSNVCPKGRGIWDSKPVSADVRTGLCSRAGIAPGNGLQRPETGVAFLATPADSGRQRPRYPASPAAKPRKVKDYSGRARKPELRRTAWWARQVYEPEAISETYTGKPAHRRSLNGNGFSARWQTLPGLRARRHAQTPRVNKTGRSPRPAHEIPITHP